MMIDPFFLFISMVGSCLIFYHAPHAENIALYVGLLCFVICVLWVMIYGLVKGSKTTVDHKTNVDALIGKQAIVVERIAGLELGLVKVGGELWSARSIAETDIEPGTSVKIVAVVGCHLVVKAF